MAQKLTLSRVALCAVDTNNPSLAAHALRRSLYNCNFNDSALITNTRFDAPCRLEIIDRLRNKQEYSHFVLNRLSSFSSSDFVLVVQWDGYVVDPSAWHDDFLKYDYIGARWPWYGSDRNVGNGGFSLRSRKLLDILASSSLPPCGDQPEDVYICRILRPVLEARFGVRFAPASVAEAFSYESTLPARASFGFHGLPNMWRHIEDRDLEEFAKCLCYDIIWSSGYAKLLAQYALLRKFEELRILFGRLYNDNDREKLITHLSKNLETPKLAEFVFDTAMRASQF